jgi:hypothetical protein
MKEKGKRLLIGGLSGAIGGALGAVSGSSSWIVVGLVSAAFAVLAAWGLSGMIK